MTLKDVVIKNFKFNIAKFKAFFLCSSFVVMILFLYCSFYFNPSIVDYTQQTPLRLFMRFSLYGIGLFAIIFTTYANNTFVRSRNSEFGLMMILGMNKKDIEKFIRIETYAISGLSLIFGLVSGRVIAKIFFLLGTEILEVSKLKFDITLESYLIPIGIYLLICLCLYIGRKRFLKSIELVEMIKATKKGKEVKVKTYLGVIGFVCTAFSIVVLLLFLQGDLNSKLVPYGSIAMTATGLYLVITHLGGLVTTIRKKSYFKHMISFAAIRYRFAEYRKVLFVVSMLCTVAIIAISIVFSMYREVKVSTDRFSPYDIQYLAEYNEDNLSQIELESLIHESGSTIESKGEMTCILTNLYAVKEGDFSLWDHDSTYISLSTLNRLTNNDYSIKKQHVLTLRNVQQEDGWRTSGEQLRIKENNEKYEFTVEKEIYEILGNANYTRIFDVKFVIVLRDDDYERLKTAEQLNESKMYYYMLGDKTKVLKAYHKIVEADTNRPSTENYIQAKYDRYTKVSSHAVEYLACMRQFGFQLFIVGFIGVVMLISSGVVLFFKVSSDLEEMKKKYQVLIRLGMTTEEIKSCIKREIRPLFILPIVLGGVLGIGFASVLFVNVHFYLKILRDACLIVCMFTLCQWVFFKISYHKCYQVIIN